MFSRFHVLVFFAVFAVAFHTSAASAQLNDPHPVAQQDIEEPMSESRAERPSGPGDTGGAAQPAPAHHEEEDYAPPTLVATLQPAGKPEAGKREQFTLSLTRDGKPVKGDMLAVRHTQKMHLTLIDETLGDFQHIHPSENMDGGFMFGFTPATSNSYMLWADVKFGDENPQMVPIRLHGTAPCKEDCAVRRVAAKAGFTGGEASLVFDKPVVRVGQQLDMDVFLTDKDGNPLSGLEPVMGAYGHAFAIADDMSSIQHLHPRGAQPANDDARGASPLSFSLTPAKRGFLKVFVQLRHGGKDVMLPFGVNVE